MLPLLIAQARWGLSDAAFPRGNGPLGIASPNRTQRGQLFAQLGRSLGRYFGFNRWYSQEQDKDGG